MHANNFSLYIYICICVDMRSCVYIHIYTVCVYIPQNPQGVAVKKKMSPAMASSVPIQTSVINQSK